eukprot:763840-Hanusia_phi.AAC.1
MRGKGVDMNDEHSVGIGEEGQGRMQSRGREIATELVGDGAGMVKSRTVGSVSFTLFHPT